MKFKEYFDNCDGHYIAFEANGEKLLILNESQDVVKEVYISRSVKDIDLSFSSIFDSYTNENNLITELSIMENGHDGKDWLFFSQHVFVL